MSLTLPADLELALDADGHDPRDTSVSGVYALVLARPDSLVRAWDRHHDTRPSDWSIKQAADADTLAYVGSSVDLLHRLEEHKNGEVRQTTLTAVCDIERLHMVRALPDADRDRRRAREYNVAVTLRQERPGWVVRQA